MPDAAPVTIATRPAIDRLSRLTIASRAESPQFGSSSARQRIFCTTVPVTASPDAISAPILPRNAVSTSPPRCVSIAA